MSNTFTPSPALLAVLKDFEQRRLWGQIQLDYQNGKLVVIRKQETIKPTEEDNRYERPNTNSR